MIYSTYKFGSCRKSDTSLGSELPIRVDAINKLIFNSEHIKMKHQNVFLVLFFFYNISSTNVTFQPSLSNPSHIKRLIFVTITCTVDNIVSG